jgi:hypothetical protein
MSRINRPPISISRIIKESKGQNADVSIRKTMDMESRRREADGNML